MKIFIPKEQDPLETRCAVVPAIAARLVELGAELEVEPGVGRAIDVLDQDFAEKGAKISEDREDSMNRADLVMRLSVPSLEEIEMLRAGCIHVSYMDPFNQHLVVKAFADAGTTAISMEMIPRTTLAQKMDSLSSQANLGGYQAVIVAADRSRKALPMMMTPAGTISPAKVFVIGAGVAGLQAIATAKRLGARVEAFDTRPVVEEQVKSLGARFVKIDVGETGQTKDGYAKQLTEEQLAKQREGMARILSQSDIVITTAQVFGKKAPRIISADMMSGMKPGSVVVDMAVETGGNVEGSVKGEEKIVDGVRIIGLPNLAGQVAADASFMYASNLYNLVEHFWNKDAKRFDLDFEDEILAGCVVTHAGRIRNEMIKNVIG
ncbi:MAG: NAD(P) transhydrogenase subunit alpha [Planctomycetota bacterium]|jgi:NAD(P) transhydrogenase subunit alpha